MITWSNIRPRKAALNKAVCYFRRGIVPMLPALGTNATRKNQISLLVK